MVNLLDNFKSLMGIGENVVSFGICANKAMVEKFLRMRFAEEEKPKEIGRERNEKIYIKATTKRKLKSVVKNIGRAQMHINDCLQMQTKDSEEYVLLQKCGVTLWKIQKEASATLEAYLAMRKSKKVLKEVK